MSTPLRTLTPNELDTLRQTTDRDMHQATRQYGFGGLAVLWAIHTLGGTTLLITHAFVLAASLFLLALGLEYFAVACTAWLRWLPGGAFADVDVWCAWFVGTTWRPGSC
jgi:hypothetical protein